MNIMKEINKKIVIYSILVLMTLGIILFMNYREGQASIETISNKIIRFHVIANSDTVEDQSLKLAIRDEVLEYIQPKLESSKDLDQSRNILESNSEKIIEIAEKVIEENGYEYKVEISLKRENFPVKTYGNVTLPEGEYEAYKIVIGTGQGHNWWCVMFPPLCFTDITEEESVKKNETNMKKVLTEDEYELVDNTTDSNLDSHSEEKDSFIQGIREFAKSVGKDNSKDFIENTDGDLENEDKAYKMEEKSTDKSLMDDNCGSDNENKRNIEIRFKLLDIFNDLFE